MNGYIHQKKKIKKKYLKKKKGTETIASGKTIQMFPCCPAK